MENCTVCNSVTNQMSLSLQHTSTSGIDRKLKDKIMGSGHCLVDEIHKINTHSKSTTNLPTTWITDDLSKVDWFFFSPIVSPWAIFWASHPQQPQRGTLWYHYCHGVNAAALSLLLHYYHLLLSCSFCCCGNQTWDILCNLLSWLAHIYKRKKYTLPSLPTENHSQHRSPHQKQLQPNADNSHTESVWPHHTPTWH